MSEPNVVDVKVRDLERSVDLLNSLVESYKFEMALMKRERDELLEGCLRALTLVSSFQYAQAQVCLRELLNPIVMRPDPVQSEIESVT